MDRIIGRFVDLMAVVIVMSMLMRFVDKIMSDDPKQLSHTRTRRVKEPRVKDRTVRDKLARRRAAEEPTTTTLAVREPYAVVTYNPSTPSLQVFGLETEAIPTGPEYDDITMTEIGERQKTVIHIPKDLPIREREPVKEPIKEPEKVPVER